MSEHETTKEELYEKAQELDIDGRSTMDKEELAAAVATAESETSEPEPEPEPEIEPDAVDDDYVVKSRREEEDEQHERREARDAEIEEAASKAKRTPF